MICIAYGRCRSQTVTYRGKRAELKLAASVLLPTGVEQAHLSYFLQDHHADVLDAAEAQPEAGANPAAVTASDSPAQNKSTGIYYSDKALLGLGLYAVSSVFLATMLICAKTLSRRGFPTWQNLLCRSLSIMAVALVICAKQKVNPFGNRYESVSLHKQAHDQMHVNAAWIASYKDPTHDAINHPEVLTSLISCVNDELLFDQVSSLLLSASASSVYEPNASYCGIADGVCWQSEGCLALAPLAATSLQSPNCH